jgi:protein DJ-1
MFYAMMATNTPSSRGPGTAFPFALKLVEALEGGERRQEVQKPMIFQSE